jgi:hypothetical protein
MDYAKPGFWIAIIVGGAIVAILSAIQQYSTAESPFTFRPIFRDFFLGSFVTASMYMFLPESFDSMVSNMPSLPSLASITGTSAAAAAAAADAIEEWTS